MPELYQYCIAQNIHFSEANSSSIFKSLLSKHKKKMNLILAHRPKFFIAQENPTVLEHSNCSEHSGKCPNPWIMTPEVHDLLHRLPPELQQMVIKEAIVPPPQCIKNVFGHCYNPWECKEGAHDFHASTPPPVIPSPCCTSRCEFVCAEGHKAFFRNNVFIFKSVDRRRFLFLSMDYSRFDYLREWFRDLDWKSREDRDHRATRLLDFTDLPLFKGRGSFIFSEEFNELSYKCVNEYRYQIRHLVFIVDVGSRPTSSPGKLPA